MQFFPKKYLVLDSKVIDTVDNCKLQLGKVKKFSDLPENCQEYVKKTEELINVPINFIGVGVHRDEMIYR